MSQTQNILIKATGAGNSSDVTVHKIPITVSIFPKANFGADTGNLTMKNTDGTYDDVYRDGTQVQLTATNPQYIIYGGGVFRIEFSARTAAIGADATEGPLA